MSNTSNSDTRIITLRYPKHWTISTTPFSGHHSQYAETAARDTTIWLGSQKLLDIPGSKEWIEQANVASYAGASCLLGNYRACLLHCEQITLWLYWDDRVTEKLADMSTTDESERRQLLMHLEDVRCVMYNRPLPPSPRQMNERQILLDRFTTAWASIASRCLEGATSEFTKLFGDSFSEWIDATITECLSSGTVNLGFYNIFLVHDFCRYIS